MSRPCEFSGIVEVRAVLQQWKKRGRRSYHAMGRTSRSQPHFRVCFNLLAVAATMPFAAKHSRHDVAKSRRRGLSPGGCFFKWRFARPLRAVLLHAIENVEQSLCNLLRGRALWRRFCPVVVAQEEPKTNYSPGLLRKCAEPRECFGAKVPRGLTARR
jgi:hypothetical protein